MDRVIRVNVHLGEEEIKFLDALRKEINGDKYYDTVSRADLIRWALVEAVKTWARPSARRHTMAATPAIKVLKERQKTAKQTDKKRGA